MATAIALPAPAKTARRAAEILAAWTADPEMPTVEGCAGDAVRVLAVRAAVHEATGDEHLAALPAPAGVELTARLLDVQFPELRTVLACTGHTVIHGAAGIRWQPGDYMHRVYVEAFGSVNGRHWPV
jgi:hypothetical protein